ncbi:TPA: fimbrial protein [Escherichia coli]
MKKTIMSLAVVSALLSGHAMAALNTSGQADNSASAATLNFSGKVTSSLCQLKTDDLIKDISLGEISAAQLRSGTGRAPAQSFDVTLENCDSTVNEISYVIRDGNGSPDQGEATATYLIPKSTNTSAKGVGVFIVGPEGEAIDVGDTKTYGATKGPDGALATQTISLAAYIGTASGQADSGNSVVAGDVNAVGVMTIKAAAAAK